MSGHDSAKQNALRVLVIDDDPVQHALLRVIFGKIDYPAIEAAFAKNGQQGVAMLRGASIDIVLTDYRLPDIGGLEVLRLVKEQNPAIHVVVMTAFENAREAVELMKEGVDDYLIKPTLETEIRHLLVRTHEKLTLVREENLIRREIEEYFDPSALVFRSREMARVLQIAARCAPADTTVLITGESGTGKELIASLIHKTGKRKDQRFVTVNIAALSESLVESELFGHRKGAFTGAVEDRMGRFEEADGGTIFIDEVGDVTTALQVKLLRVIQFGEVQRIGENATRKLDVRIIAATNRNLEDMVKKRQFRTDLYYRLNVIPIRLPPLRERKSDIPGLIDHFLARYNEKHGKTIRGISREAMDVLMRTDFPAFDATAADGESCDPTTLEGTFDQKMRSFELQLLENALKEAEGNQSKAARLLGISERHLRSRMEKLDLNNIWKSARPF